ncbi:curli assembly protein CsgF [Pseudovibrio sp. Tun.PSC04-5.I4]|uniref:curli assembly protein CsgF n=1 Tax=Pseudovibrio sp. Tun.PSC04-5.I4 TaxID=1798213 RepID=UPI000B845C72|nr:curli assembly protein CsgF [Pseudovibrio sp. Tun.PSC04-5.I4]
MRLKFALGLTLGCALSVGSAYSQQLVYQPVNPSFGGYANNTTHLFATANAQKTATISGNKGYGTGSGDGTDGSGNSLADLFVRQLQNRLIYSLADQVSKAIFGEDPKDSGTVSFGDQKVTFVRGDGSIQLQIIDESTGAVTDITVPILQTATPIN